MNMDRQTGHSLNIKAEILQLSMAMHLSFEIGTLVLESHFKNVWVLGLFSEVEVMGHFAVVRCDSRVQLHRDPW